MRRPLLAPAALALLSLSLPAAAQDLNPAGSMIGDAINVDVTPEGFAKLGELLPALVPASVEIPYMGDSYDGAAGQCWLGGYAYSVSNGKVNITISDMSLVPQEGYLQLDATFLIAVNSSSDPMYLYYSAECLDDTCDGHVDAFPATISTTIALQVLDSGGTRSLDATIGSINLSYSLSSSDIHLDGCAIGTVEDVLNFFGLSIYDLILPLVQDQLNSAINDFGPQIETLIEDAFSQATIEQTVDLNGVSANLALAPSAVEIKPAGVRLSMDGSMSTSEVAPCVAAYDPGGSLSTPSDLPGIGTAPSGVSPGYHLGLLLSDDFGNQALYSLWRGGLLCYTIDDSANIGVPITTDLLGLLAGDSFKELFPESKPMIIQTRPKAAPTLDFAGEHDVGIDVTQLGLEFYGELDNRQALIVGLDLDALAGVDLNLDGATGNLGIDVALSGDDVIPTVTDNEFEPDASGDIEASFSGVFDTLVGSLIGGLVGDLAFALPSFDGFGLSSLEVSPAGPSGDWLGAYASLDQVDYVGSGCGSGGGCSMGCAAGSKAPGAGWLFLGIPLVVAGLRRRRQD